MNMLCCICGHFCIRGRPFDSEAGGGGGWQILSGQNILFSIRSAEKFIFRYTKARIFIFIRNKILKKPPPPPKKKTTTTTRGGGGGRNVAWFRRVAGKDLLYDFYIPGLKGSPGASCNRIVCTSVRPSFLPAFKEQYLKFGWWYSYQKWTVSSSLDCSHFPDIACPWGGTWSNCRAWRFFLIFWISCFR